MQIAELQYQLDDSILTQRVLRLRVGATDVRIFMDQAAGKLQAKVVVPGFRKGKASLALVRQYHAGRVGEMAFEEIKKAALNQVFQQLEENDQPFIPPEVEEPSNVKLYYGQELEFAVKYLVNPSGVGKQPEQPQETLDPLGQQLHSRAGRGLQMGIPEGPTLPVIPQAAKVVDDLYK